MAKNLRAAVIGVGYLGNFHAQKYKNVPGVELVGVCDSFPTQVQKVAQDLKVQAFTRAQDLIGQVDLVTIAATTTAHYELAKLFLQNGVHVNVEKPMAAQTSQAEELLQIAKKNKLKLAVGHIERFNPAIIELRKHLKAPSMITLTRWAPFKSRGADVSVLHDLMIHDIDLMFWLAGSKVESWLAQGQKILTSQLDVAEATFKMEAGPLVHISVNRMAAQTVRQIQVVQKESVLVAQTGTLTVEKTSPVDVQAAQPLKVEQWTVEKADALQAETQDFVTAVRDDRAPAVTGEDGLMALDWVEKIEARIFQQS